MPKLRITTHDKWAVMCFNGCLMKNNTHTPGPWKNDGHDGKHCVLVTSQYGTVAAVWPIGAVDQERANSRLIAAAPELLEALKNAVAMNYGNAGLRGEHDNIGWVRIASAAIAKAESAS